MAEHEQESQSHSSGHAGGGHEPISPTVLLLEKLDNWAHVVVATFFILMALAMFVHIGFIFAGQLPLIIPRASVAETAANTRATSVTPKEPQTASEPGKGTGEASGTHAGKAEGATEAHEASGQETGGHTASTAEVGEHKAPDPFDTKSLELLSNILFAVILLELLRTIITYLQTHDIQAIMQEFLVVGIISSVRKILLVGAEASLNGSKGVEFIQEATGVVINILGILLLILGLVMLRKAYGNKVVKEGTKEGSKETMPESK